MHDMGIVGAEPAVDRRNDGTRFRSRSRGQADALYFSAAGIGFPALPDVPTFTVCPHAAAHGAVQVGRAAVMERTAVRNPGDKLDRAGPIRPRRVREMVVGRAGDIISPNPVQPGRANESG